MNLRNFFIVLILVAILGGGIWLLRRPAAEPVEAGGEPEVHAEVQTAPLKQGVLEETISAYGSVVSSSADARSISLPYEARIVAVLVAAGQEVQAGTPLLKVEPSAAAQLELDMATQAKTAAEVALAQTQKRFDLKLAVNADLETARQAMREATLKVASVETYGQHEIAAEKPGIVGDIPSRIGQIVPAGTPLLEVASLNDLEVRLGAEPEAAARIAPASEVKLTFVHQPEIKDAVGTVRMVTRRVNPQTRLVDVFVSLPKDTAFLLDGYVQAALQLTSQEGLIAPRESIVTGAESDAVFTIHEGKAVRHAVEVAHENESEALISGEDLHPGDGVITTGAYQAEDGMEVSTGQL